MVVFQPKHPQMQGVTCRKVPKLKPKSLFTVVNDLCFSMHHFKIKLFNLLQIVDWTGEVFLRARKERVEDGGSQSPLVVGCDKSSLNGFNLPEMQIMLCTKQLQWPFLCRNKCFYRSTLCCIVGKSMYLLKTKQKHNQSTASQGNSGETEQPFSRSDLRHDPIIQEQKQYKEYKSQHNVHTEQNKHV